MNITPMLLVALGVGTILMMAVMLFCRRWYSIVLWKAIVTAPVLTFFGLFSVKIMFFFESGNWTGLSFFGAVFLIPLWFYPVSRFMKVPYGALVDQCAPSICVMLAIMKIQCLLTGCCKGRVLYENAAGEAIRFPSQIVELVTALALMVVLIYLMKKTMYHGRIYPLFMLLYGASRFILNLLRETTPFVWLLPAGNFWSLVAITIGIMWLMLIRHMERTRYENHAG